MTFNSNKKLKVINLFGGPGIGKSTVAAALFANMKRMGEKVELVHEIAKDFYWEKWQHILTEQDFLFAQQHRQIRRLVGHDIDYVIVDCSLLLGLAYKPDWYPPSFDQFVVDVYNTYTNYNFLLKRTTTFLYVSEGRNESYRQALEKDKQIVDLLNKYNVSYIEILSDNNVDTAILQHVGKLLEKDVDKCK